jgi:hypothetical protein
MTLTVIVLIIEENKNRGMHEIGERGCEALIMRVIL